MPPLLSIVIPTKNRTELIEKLIKRIDGSIPTIIEYVIHDNSTIPLNLHIKQIDRIRYFHDKQKLSVSANFSNALNCARGQFVAFMGDDDEANHESIVELLSKPDIIKFDTIVSPVYDLLFHSESGTRWTGQFKEMTKIKPNYLGRLILWFIYRFSRLTSKFSYFWLLSPDLWAVPRGYFGIFNRGLLQVENLKEGSREIYLSPDAYLIGRLTSAREILHVNKQLFTPGTSSTSTSNLSNARKHIGTISEQKHFDKEDIQALPKKIPDSFFPEVIWAASYLSAINSERINHIHLTTIRQFIRMKYGVKIGGVLPEITNLSESIIGASLGVLFFILNRFIVALLILARYKLSDQQKYDVC